MRGREIVSKRNTGTGAIAPWVRCLPCCYTLHDFVLFIEMHSIWLCISNSFLILFICSWAFELFTNLGYCTKYSDENISFLINDFVFLLSQEVMLIFGAISILLSIEVKIDNIPNNRFLSHHNLTNTDSFKNFWYMSVLQVWRIAVLIFSS